MRPRRTSWRQAGIDRAKVLVSVMPNDAENVFITLTARQMCSTLVIIARAEGPSTTKKLRQAGADHVVMPAAIGAHRIVSLLDQSGRRRVHRAGHQSIERGHRDGRAADRGLESRWPASACAMPTSSGAPA